MLANVSKNVQEAVRANVHRAKIALSNSVVTKCSAITSLDNVPNQPISAPLPAKWTVIALLQSVAPRSNAPTGPAVDRKSNVQESPVSSLCFWQKIP